MKIIDCHVHSDLSFDSEEPMENYIRMACSKGQNLFLTTEHLDLDCYTEGFSIVPDFNRQQKLLKSLGEKYGIKTLFGVEIGYREDLLSENDKTVKLYPFDFVILSVHEAPDPLCPRPWARAEVSADEGYSLYLSLVLDAVSFTDDFDSLGHIDYPLRYIGHADPENHREFLEKIFRILVEKDKSLELNTKIFPDGDAVRRAEYIFSFYRSLGGRRITLGSDCHSVKKMGNCFDKACDILKNCGFTEICIYIDRTPVEVKL